MKISGNGNNLDVTAPDQGVEIRIRDDAKVIWVNVDGLCILRICQIPHLVLNNEKTGTEEELC